MERGAMVTGGMFASVPRAKAFDVICAGEALWKVATPGPRSPGGTAAARLRPGGGPVAVAIALAARGLRVGLVTVLADDTLGRSSLETIAASGVDVGGVALARPRAGFLRVDARGATSELPRATDEEPVTEVPAAWTSGVLLLSGLSPVISRAAALCKAARAARRVGTFVLIDFNASLHTWAGHDPRTIRMVLREVDAARCSVADLAVIGMTTEMVRAALRPGAVLVVGDGDGGAVATGPFGEVTVVPSERGAPKASGSGDALTAAICAELARRGEPGESSAARWHRAIASASASASRGA